MKVAIITTIIRQVMTMGCTGARILPCPAMAMQAAPARTVKLRRIFTYVSVKRTKK